MSKLLYEFTLFYLINNTIKYNIIYVPYYTEYIFIYF